MSSIPPPPPEGTADEGQPSYTSAKDARAQGKAQKAYRKASRPWYQKKRFWLLGLIALFIIFAIATSGGDEDSTTTSPSPSPTDQVVQEDEDAAAEEEDAAAEEETDEPPADEPTEEEDAPAQEAIVVTSQELIDELESNALRAKTTYEGERVTVTGYVGNIDASGATSLLIPSRTPSSSLVSRSNSTTATLRPSATSPKGSRPQSPERFLAWVRSWVTRSTLRRSATDP